eukprot:403368609
MVKQSITLQIFALTLIVLTVSFVNSKSQSLRELEIQVMQEKVDLLKQKLNLLEQLQYLQTSQQRENFGERDDQEISGSKMESYYQYSLDQLSHYKEAFQFKFQYYINQLSLGGSSQRQIQRLIDTSQDFIPSVKSLVEKEIISFDDQEIKVFDFIQTKTLKYAGAKSNVNQLIAVALSNGEIILRNPQGQELARFDSGLGSDIIDFASPQTVDESYFAILNSQGQMKVYNYTIVESQMGYYKYAREEYGLMKRNDSKSIEEVMETKYGKRMLEAGFPLKFTKPFIWIEDEMEFNIKELISDNLDLGMKFDKNTTTFKDFQIYQVRGQKYFVLLDNFGYINVFFKNLRFKTRFFSETEKVSYITKNSNNLMIARNNSIAFVRVFENKLAPNYCESGTSNLKKIGSDNLHLGILYGLSENNEVFIFDQKQHGNKHDSIECRIIGKIQLFDNEENQVNLTMTSIKGGLLFQDSNGKIFILNTTDTQQALMQPSITSFTPSYLAKSQTSQNFISGQLLDIKEIRNVASISIVGSLLLMRVPSDSQDSGNNKLILLEYQSTGPISTSGGGLWDNLNFKFPAIFVLVLAVVGYMMWNKQSQHKSSKGVAGLGFGPSSKGSKFSSSKLKRK